MEQERWKRVEGLFHQALCLKSSERDNFLDAACPEDPGIRHSVAALLSQANEGTIDLCLSGAQNEIRPPIEPGGRIDHFRIIEKIGSGGMGSVWLAEDTRLRRNVAIKLLDGIAYERPSNSPKS